MRDAIRPLPPETVNRIAAGEVVERPASVLKELLENALDAGATRIELEIASGGIGLIRLSDDGHGIPREELEGALERHATSKIRSLADLEEGGSLGFRGEALAAIASVSRLEICSRIEDDESAWVVQQAGDAAEGPRPRARERGTTVTVRELFGEVPARRKFLRSEAAEKRALLALWQRYLLAYPELGFLLREGGRELAHYPPVRDLRERAGQVLGSATARHMVELSAEEGSYRLSGLATLPLVSRGNRSQQYIYLGRRPIEDRQVSHAITQAYGDVLAPGRFPVCLLFLELPRGTVDVNVHPAKREVRFRDTRRIHHLVSRGLKEAIGGRSDLGRMLAEREDLLLGTPRAEAAAAGREPGSATGAAKGERGTPAQGSLGLSRAGLRSAGSAREAFLSLGGASLGAERQDVDPGRQEERLFWQLHHTFILTQIRGGLVIIDQHNAHERVLYDRAQEALAGAPADTQRLLFPHTVELSDAEMQAYREQEGFFRELGFLVEEFGESTLSVVGIPESLQRFDSGEVIRDILDDVIAETGGPSERRDRALISYSCKSAIKAGEPMREEEMRHLVDQLFGTANPYTCPHGRPIVIRISMDELEKRFQRRVPETDSPR